MASKVGLPPASGPKHVGSPRVGRSNSRPDQVPDKVSVIAHQLAKFTSLYFTGAGERPQDQYETTLERCLEKLRGQYHRHFSDAVKHLDKSSLATAEGFTRVIDSMLEDDRRNWGRVVTIFCFAGYLIEFECERGGMERDQLAHMLGSYITDKMGSWILQNGGWDGMVDFFRSPTEDLWKKVLYAGLTISAIGSMALFKVFKS